MKIAPAAFLFSLLALLGACESKSHVPATPTTPTLPPASAREQELLRQQRTCRQGLAQARADGQQGTMKYYFWGIGIPGSVDSLKPKYGIIPHIAGCSVDPEETARWECYNKVMDSVIVARFGTNVIP
ncbi:hypothetical protein LGH70_18530 [Hymenobacter sp. BT635]|uniref:Lipoprotein n=1 Tax=Hymenobacter nitidus TaxID=2880929 RepID=A0ABS8AKT6_9BACT|nr:hypothetical protein [Hymenobacter nitidus]MCB2379599.1 hypothetical protein [Hymenobacter nitidus]